MINSSTALPQSSDIVCEFCDSTTYVYCKFKNYPTNWMELEKAETSQSSDNQENPQILPITPESPFIFKAPELIRSEVAGVKLLSNKNQLEMHPAANDVTNKPLKQSTNNINFENNFAGCSKKLDVPKTKVKRKLFETVKPEIPPKKIALKSKPGRDDTYKFLPGLSDSIADNFLQQFDREIGKNSTECLSKLKQEDLCKQCNLRSRGADQRQQKAVPLLNEESFGNRIINLDINQSGSSSTSEESSSTDQTESTEKNDVAGIQKKINVLVRSDSRSSVSSDTDSISSIASSVSRYGRIRKPSSVYVNATMFNGSVKKSAKVKKNASTLMNSHKCQKSSSTSFEATSRYCPDQFDILTQTHKRMVSSRFEKTASKIASSEYGQTERNFQNITRKNPWRNSSFIEELSELPHENKILQSEKPTGQVTPPAAGSQNGTLQSSASIGDYTKQLNLIQLPVCSRCKLTTEKDTFKRPLATKEFRSIQPLKTDETSPISQKIIIDDEIHAVVKDKVVSFKWYSATPDLESVFGNGANVYYSMRDLKSYYTNVTVGYLKLDAGLMKPMAVLKDYILLYFVERGEGIFQVSGRKISGRIGCTVFVPLGVEYSITNSSTDEDFVLKFVIISPIG